jgi:hypothetical protein
VENGASARHNVDSLFHGEISQHLACVCPCMGELVKVRLYCDVADGLNPGTLGKGEGICFPLPRSSRLVLFYSAKYSWPYQDRHIECFEFTHIAGRCQVPARSRAITQRHWTFSRSMRKATGAHKRVRVRFIDTYQYFHFVFPAIDFLYTCSMCEL